MPKSSDINKRTCAPYGIFDDRARRFSLESWLDLHRGQVLFIQARIAEKSRRRSSRRPIPGLALPDRGTFQHPKRAGSRP